MYGLHQLKNKKCWWMPSAGIPKGDLRPAAHDAEEERDSATFLVEKGWELGFLQASVPEAYGGFGERSAVTGVLAAEELAYGDLAGSLAIMLPATFVIPILVWGKRRSKEGIHSRSD